MAAGRTRLARGRARLVLAPVDSVRVAVVATLAGDVKEDREGLLCKENYGMASGRAVSDRTVDLDAFDAAKKGFFREGISSSRTHIREGQESVGAVLIEMITGVQSAFTYVGARSITELHEQAVVGVQTWAGYGEGTPHGTVRR